MFPIVKISYGFLSLENIHFIEDLLTIADILFIEKALIAYKRFYIPLWKTGDIFLSNPFKATPSISHI